MKTLLLLTALLQPTERFSVHLYEKRRDYTRTRMDQVASYLEADSVESSCTDHIYGEGVQADEAQGVVQRADSVSGGRRPR